MNLSRRMTLPWLGVAAAGLLALNQTVYALDEPRRLFVPSAIENTANNTVSLPLIRGTSQGRTVWFVVLDASSSEAAARYGANLSSKLQNARGTFSVQKVQIVDGVIDFPATVNFSPERVIVPGPEGFPPTKS